MHYALIGLPFSRTKENILENKLDSIHEFLRGSNLKCGPMRTNSLWIWTLGIGTLETVIARHDSDRWPYFLLNLLQKNGIILSQWGSWNLIPSQPVCLTVANYFPMLSSVWIWRRICGIYVKKNAVQIFKSVRVFNEPLSCFLVISLKKKYVFES